ncbi:MAG: chorismate-binding protein [Bacteroidota bacterium]
MNFDQFTISTDFHPNFAKPMKPIFSKKVTSVEAAEMSKNLLLIGQRINYFSILETGLSNKKEKNYDFIAGIGAKNVFNLSNKNLESIDDFLDCFSNEWKFVQINYNLFKSIYSNINSKNKQLFNFNLLTIFIPETVIILKDNDLSIYVNFSLIKSIFDLNNQNKISNVNSESYNLIKHVDFNEYEIQFNKIQAYLKRGDIYEVNYCIPFLINTNKPDLINIYLNQKSKSPAPFAAFLKCNNDYLLCASPERFIKKTGQQITCFPMKGTMKKTDDAKQNELLKSQLQLSEKERAENVMIVDLTRNDLSKIAQGGSVNVEELFGVYEFPQVFQMISTVEAQLKEGTPFSTILKALFPMGSMTGAPKINAIKIIDEVECFSRELFSGSVGYIDPYGDFDFNVVIRSILYNSEKEEALVAAGGAITVHSNVIDEYNECLLKANANLQLLGIDYSEINLHQS